MHSLEIPDNKQRIPRPGRCLGWQDGPDACLHWTECADLWNEVLELEDMQWTRAW